VYCTFIQIHELIPGPIGLDRISNNECESTNHNSSIELQISRSLKFSDQTSKLVHLLKVRA